MRMLRHNAGGGRDTTLSFGVVLGLREASYSYVLSLTITLTLVDTGIQYI